MHCCDAQPRYRDQRVQDNQLRVRAIARVHRLLVAHGLQLASRENRVSGVLFLRLRHVSLPAVVCQPGRHLGAPNKVGVHNNILMNCRNAIHAKVA